MISHKKKLSLRAACAVMCMLAAGAAHAQTYKLNLPMDDDPDTVLQTIAVLAKETRVTLLLKNTSDDDVGVCVHPAGAADAFTLRALDTGDVLQQTAFSGVSDCSVRRDTVRPGKQKTLRLTFPRLPKGATRLQLGENDCQPNADSDVQNWCFRDIELTAP